ncbi:MAG: hypothetical protein JSV89_06340 [Spirochaetaceae bacterium]|nr:MAG: hypothetical protein JSV89_06340 [Spirochaetaceae bacterium]
MSKQQTWQPLAVNNLKEIRKRFATLFPAQDYGDLAEKIGEYWISILQKVWENKNPPIKERDHSYRVSDPLARIEQKTLVIAYADSIQRSGEATLATLRDFLLQFFPAIRGMHMLPACVVVEDRFNDGYFSQVVRNRIHDRFGSNDQFATLMRSYFSMADFVLNHVDIQNPRFQAYLNGDDAAGTCFFVFAEAEFQQHLTDGDFAHVFRPRPFPLFTIFRRRPGESRTATMSLEQRFGEMARRLGDKALPREVLGILFLFNKVRNDQMLLEEDYQHILRFRAYLQDQKQIDPEILFTVSETQEVRHTPYIFKAEIRSRADLLQAIGVDPTLAAIYEQHDEAVFGQEIRALTTFSHVQADLNTATFEGMKMLAEDFSWYLSMDINLLRLDAANYAFKKWKTSCFGLPEVTHLMKILYLSIDAVSPRIVPNLEVNDQLGVVLQQMADREAPPPMMYDFHLASILPQVFNSGRVTALPRIFDLIARYDIPKTSIRFSLAESHDGKSVRGSMDLLTPAERRALADVVEANGGKIKYKSVPGGREPYELCCSTRDSLVHLKDESLEIRRYLSFYTLVFALMGRNVKSIYFNDLIALSNDHERLSRTGELRDLKRTKSDFDHLATRIRDPETFEHRIARGMNNLIALVDSDPALHFRGNEAEVLAPLTEKLKETVAVVHCYCAEDHTLVAVNVSGDQQSIVVDSAAVGLSDAKTVYDNIAHQEVARAEDGTVTLNLEPYQRMWLSADRIEVEQDFLFSV